MGSVNRQRLGVEGISTGREGRVVFRSKINLLPVRAGVGVGVATDHGRVVSLVVLGGEGSLNVMGSPGDVSP